MGLLTTWHFVIFHAMLDLDEAKKIRERLREKGLNGVLGSDISPVHSKIQEANTLSKESCIVFFLVTDNIVTDMEMMRIKDEHVSSSLHRARDNSKYMALFLGEKRKLKNRDNSLLTGLMSRQGLNVNSKYFDEKIEKLFKTKEIMPIKNLADDNVEEKQHYERDGLDEKVRPQALLADEESRSQNVEKETESAETVGEESVVQDLPAALGPSSKPDVKDKETSKNSHKDFLFKPGFNDTAKQEKPECHDGKERSIVVNQISVKVQLSDETAAKLFSSGIIEKRKYSELIQPADEGSELKLVEMTSKKKRLGKESTTNQEVLYQMKLRYPDSAAKLTSSGVIENKGDTVDSESANEDNLAKPPDIASMLPMIFSAKHEQSEAHSPVTIITETVCRGRKTRHG